ncbi:hypothetical protein LL033_11885 [Clostridium estertheticum]|uniref:hypothetical protein n=1 Tax=Clostridium estertheticum TaxID=238834 RepID=UPI001C0ABF25|nr:hypothetical protein [Clostridium estertheticum]MBU3215852.1 hypothetical protein [Clostridium estertheticum]WAG57807.1 hypothetical protein LL033_11885 [Clostridium estertheticum]
MTNNNAQDLTEGLYIPSIEAMWLKKLNNETGDYAINMKYIDKLLKGKLDYSFELIENKDLIDNIEIKEIDGKKYTLDIVNVKYNTKYNMIEDKQVIGVMGTRKLRDWSYTDGFKFNNNKMENWKRSSGKSRVGENMFCLSSIRDKNLDWARMNLKFEGKQDIGSIRAYESLPLSSVIGEIEIEPSHILIVEDFESKFDWTMSKTYLVNDDLETETVTTQEKNSIWDGEGILSDKIFQCNPILFGHSVGLLRNRYMKCAGFCGRISLFFHNYIDKVNKYNELHDIAERLDYDTYEIQDMYGNWIKVCNIDLITTPSAIKLAKYNHVVLAEKVDYVQYGEGAWLAYWKDNCGTKFGICKVDKASYLCQKDEDGKITNYRNTLSYQHLNTIPFTKEELIELVTEDKKYVEDLKNNLDFFLQEITKNDSFNIEDEIDAKFEVKSNIDATGAFIELCKKKPEFAQSKVFKDYRKNYITAYKNKLRAGKIHINNCDYAIACGNPIELLLSTVGEFDRENPISTLVGNELYCSRFGKETMDVVGFRNPHIMVSNCGVQVNKYCEEIEKYMVTSPSIVYLNSILSPILSIYNGEDYDIDCNLLTIDKTIISACSRIVTVATEGIKEIVTPIPQNDIQPDKKNNKKELTGLNMSSVDTIIAQNYIGSVINLSMEIHSKMNDIRYKNPTPTIEVETEINNLFKKVSKLSSISQVEIDKSKKTFEHLNVTKELEKMKIGMELVDDKKVLKVREEIAVIKTELSNKKIEINRIKIIARKVLSKELRGLQNTLRINSLVKLTDEEVVSTTDIIKTLESELEGVETTDKIARKLITKPLGLARKSLQEDIIVKLTDEELILLTDRIIALEHGIEVVNMFNQNKLDRIKNKVNVKNIELTNLDKRRIKPYFFKFIGDNESKKQRKTTNKKHRKMLDAPIIEKYCADNRIDKVDKKDKKLIELLKANTIIQEAWENKIYDREMETPMNWLQDELDTIKDSNRSATFQVIQLVNASHHVSDNDKVATVIKLIKDLDSKITTYNIDTDLSYKDKLDNIQNAKAKTVGLIRKLQLNKADMFGTMQKGLNTVKKVKVDKTKKKVKKVKSTKEIKKVKKVKVDYLSGIESITIEIMFRAFGTKLLEMFI